MLNDHNYITLLYMHTNFYFQLQCKINKYINKQTNKQTNKQIIGTKNHQDQPMRSEIADILFARGEAEEDKNIECLSVSKGMWVDRKLGHRQGHAAVL